MVSVLVALQIQNPIQDAADQARDAVRIRAVSVPAVVPVVISALESLAEVVLVLGQVYVVAVIAKRSVLISERVLVVKAPAVFAIGLTGLEAFLIPLVQCTAKHVRAVLIRVVVSPTAIVAISERRVVITTPRLQPQLVLTQSLIIVPLKAQLRDSTLLFERTLSLIYQPFLFLLLPAVLRRALLLPPLPFQLLLLTQSLLVALLTPDLLLTLLVNRLTLLINGLTLLAFSLSLLLELGLLLLRRGLTLTPLIHALLLLLSLLLLSSGLALTPFIHALLLLLSLLILLLLSFSLTLTPFVHALLLLLSLLLLSVGLALLPPSLTLLLLLLLLRALLCLLLSFGLFLLLLLLLGSLIIGLCARQSAGSNQQGNYDNSQVCHPVKEFVFHMSSRIANALPPIVPTRSFSRRVKGKEHAIDKKTRIQHFGG